MALFKDLFSSARSQKQTLEFAAPEAARSNGAETVPIQMNLEERMAFRRELLCETIRSSLNTHAIVVHTYRFKVMRTDRRGHCFVIMLDMSPAFMASPAGQLAEQAVLAALIVENANSKYGLVVGGVYWRVDETLDTAVASWATRGPKEPADTRSNIENMGDGESFEHVSAKELADFEASWNNDTAVQIGNRTYASDLAPLASDLAPLASDPAPLAPEKPQL